MTVASTQYFRFFYNNISGFKSISGAKSISAFFFFLKNISGFRLFQILFIFPYFLVLVMIKNQLQSDYIIYKIHGGKYFLNGIIEHCRRASLFTSLKISKILFNEPYFSQNITHISSKIYTLTTSNQWQPKELDPSLAIQLYTRYT